MRNGLSQKPDEVDGDSSEYLKGRKVSPLEVRASVVAAYRHVRPHADALEAARLPNVVAPSGPRTEGQLPAPATIEPPVRPVLPLQSNFLKQRNQSTQRIEGSVDSTRSFAAPQDPGGGTITSSPGCQSAGVATLNLSEACIASSKRLIS